MEVHAEWKGEEEVEYFYPTMDVVEIGKKDEADVLDPLQKRIAMEEILMAKVEIQVS